MIFRAYDIRGVFGNEMTPELALKIGIAFGNMVPGEIVVGRDIRTSSPLLTKALIAGLLSAGNQVTDIGMVASPVLYYAVVTRKTDGGVMITASHNPPEYNGFKLCRKNAVCLTEESGIIDIKNIIENNSFSTCKWDQVKPARNTDVIPEYLEYLAKLVKPEKRLRVVVDVGNGSCGFCKPLLEQFCDVTMLFEKPDGRFPNHVPDPLKEENIDTLKETVVREGADLGIGFDGDGDRVGFVDEKGNLIDGDKTLMIFAKNALEKNPGGTILHEVRCSRAVGEFVKGLGGKSSMVRIGHSYIHNAVLESKALLAGELSGHFYIGGDYFGYDDGVLAALKMIEAVSKLDELSTFVARLPKYYPSPEYRIKCPDERKFRIMSEIKKDFHAKGGDIIDIDGIRVEFEDGWLMVRASNTQPALVARVEGTTPEAMERLNEQVLMVLKQKLGILEFL